MEEKDYKQVPVYREIDDLGDIRGLGRQDEKAIKFHENNEANSAVIEWMNANRHLYFPDANHFDANTMINYMANKFGLDRSMHVLLHNVSDYDGRFADDVKHRSRTEHYIMKPFDNREGHSRQADSAEFGYCHTDMHPVYLDSLIKYGMELEREQLRENLPKFKLGSKFTDEHGTELQVIGMGIGNPQKAGWYDDDRIAARLGEKQDITLVVGMENGRADGGTWIFAMKPHLQLNPDNTVTICDYGHEIVKDYAFDPLDGDYTKDWTFSAKDFEIGFTYLNHNGFPYVILDKGMTYLDEPFIKVQSVSIADNPDHWRDEWTAWCVKPEILEDGTLEWAYSKERDMTLPPAENILTEENQMESINVTANMTALMSEKSANNLVGFATVTVGDSYAISNIAVYASNNSRYQNPFYTSMPEIKGISGEYHPIVFTTPEAREAINRAVSGAMITAVEQGKDDNSHYPSFSSELIPKENARDVSAVIKGDLYQGNIKANSNITLYGHIEIKDVKLMTSREGNDFAAMPQRYGSDDKYHDIVFPITKEARETLQYELTAKLIQRENVIGNTNYTDISDKTYKVVGAAYLSDITVALENAGIKYSGKENDSGTYTLTFNRADKEAVDTITGNARAEAHPDRTDIQNFINAAEQSLDRSKDLGAERV